VTDLLSIIERINQASTSEAVLEVFEQAIAHAGAEYTGIVFVPGPDDHIEDVCLAWKVPPKWRALYSGENFIQRDPAVRHSPRTVMPFDRASGPYNPETEPQVKEVVDRARDYNVHKGLQIPVPSARGIIGMVWLAGPHFDEREVHAPVLHSLSLHAFYRLEQLIGRRLHKTARLTEREREVLAWAAEGKTAWEIGRILSVSTRTVEWHFAQACNKLGARNRVQAIARFTASLMQ
jgi:LuxR family quorum sensing-dependent transcriptional regulator